MDATPAQILTLENLKAHLQSVKAEIDSVNNSLGDIFKKKSSAEEELSSIQSQISEAQINLESIQIRAREYGRIIENIAQARLDLAEEIASSHARVDQIELAHSDYIRFITSAIEQLESRRFNAEQSAQEAESNLAILGGLVGSSRSELLEIGAVLIGLQRERDSITSENADRRTTQAREIADHEKIIAGLKTQIFDAQQGVVSIKINMSEREQSIKNAESNVLILQNRVDKFWGENFPADRPPKI